MEKEEENRFRQLLQEYKHNTLPEQEEQELFALIALPSFQLLLETLVDETLETRQHEGIAMSQERMENMLTFVTRPQRPPVQVHRVRFLETAWFRYAAILLLIAGTATFLYIHNQSQNGILSQAKDGSKTAADILPGGNKAVLTLADGSVILLDSAANGHLASQDGTDILKLGDGSLAYNTNKPSSSEVLYNTISTPRGGQYQLVLPDGTRVWLNAASSLQFPTRFGDLRSVKITGEAYFEVTPDQQRPFKVIINDHTAIEVLGTSFNVNAYADEANINTTLIEGSVRIRAKGQSQMLKPDEQAQITNDSHIKLIKNADLDKITAWKNGLLNFEGSDVREVMRLISRWYDVDIIYEKGIPDIRFVGEIRKQLPLTSLIRTLEENGVHINIRDRKLIVSP